MVDWIRSIVIAEDFIVLWLYVQGGIALYCKLRKHRDAPHQARYIVWGRLARYGAVVLFAISSLETCVELWNTEHTPRLLWAALALLLAMVGWLLVEKSGPDGDIFDVLIADKVNFP